ncbi:MAG: immunoglobulin-like domain-containing protein, partial [Cardiobacterium sp.]
TPDYRLYSGIQIQTNTQHGIQDLQSKGPGKYDISGNTVNGLDVYKDAMQTYGIEFRNHEPTMDYTLTIRNNTISGESSKYLIGVLNETRHKDGSVGEGSGDITIEGNTMTLDRSARWAVPVYIEEKAHDGTLRGSVTYRNNHLTLKSASEGSIEAIQMVGNAQNYDIGHNTFALHGTIDKSVISLHGQGKNTKPQLNVHDNDFTTDSSSLGKNWVEISHKNGADATVSAHHNTLNGKALADIGDTPTPPAPQPPAENHEGTVSISGEAKVGQTLTAEVSDDDGVDSSQVKYQWQRDGQPIDGATAKTYQLTAADLGKEIRVQAQYDDQKHHHETPTSAATASVQDANSAGNHAPHELTLGYGQDADRSLSYWVKGGQSGDTVGQLSAKDADGDNINWRVSDPRFEISDSGTLKLKDGVALDYSSEKRVVMTVTATDSHGAATSRDFAVQVRDPDTHNRGEDNHPGYLGVSGGNKVGDTLQAWFDDQDGKAQGSGNYQWYANGEAIAGATGDSYTLTAAEAGKTVRVGISYQDNKGNAEHLYSAPTAAISDDAPVATLHATRNSIAEGGSITCTVSLDRPAERDMTYTIRAHHGSTSDGDYSLSAQTVTIAKGQSSASFTASANRDGAYENSETFAITATDDTGHTSRTDITIANTDAAVVPDAPTISRDGDGARITPASSADTLHLGYRDASGIQHDIDLAKAADGQWHSAAHALDYDAQTGAVTLARIQPGSDIFASNAANGVYNDEPAHLLPQTADSGPLTASLHAASNEAISEGGTASYIIRLNRPAEHDTVFNLEIRGKDADGSDLVTGTQQVTVRAGERSAVATVQTHDDNTAERTETYKAILYTHDSSVTVPAHRGSLTGEISDNDAIAPPTV